MAIKTPDIVAEQMKYPRRDIWILLGVCAFTRLVLVPWNQGEYTDGVLQVQQFVEPTGIWPPLYTAFVYPLKFLFGYLWAGRIVSAVASTLALWPLYFLTRRAFGTRAALYAGIFYICGPVAMRWSVRVMTDATFSFFFWWCAERLYFASDERDEKVARRALGLAAVGAVCAALTRFQGLTLLPPLAVVAGIVWRRFGQAPLRPLAVLLALAILPVWTYAAGFIHGEQFASRSLDGGLAGALYVGSLTGESFVAYLPYFLTYPVFMVALFGAFWTRQRRGPFFGWFMLYTGVVLLVSQSLFASFQERYFLPLFGLFYVLAGAGMYVLQERWFRTGRRIRRRMFPYLLIVVYGWSTLFALSSFVLQREVFGDIARASRAAARAAGPEARIFTNEVYRITQSPPIAADKVAFFAGRPARYLDESYVPLQPRRVRADGTVRVRRPAAFMEPGDIVVLSDLYGADYYLGYLLEYYVLSQVSDEPFTASVLPLLPDVMSTPGTNQNPSWWLHRYDWQVARTQVFRVESLR